MNELFGIALWQNILAWIITLAVLATPRIARRFQPKNLRYIRGFFIAWGITAIALNGVVIEAALALRLGGLAVTAVALFLAYRELQRFWAIGLVRVDRKVRGGVDYARSLELTKNELWFLGLGASKLTSEPNFEEAIRRCNRDGESSVRFLLMDPERAQGEHVLATAEQRAERQQNAYRDRVRDSLKRIEKLRSQRLNIEVRLYRGSIFRPLFRIMFIDDTICLVSHYVFGEGDGSQLPQLCFLNPRHVDERSADSFYSAFRRMFESYWSEGTPWKQEESQ